MEINYKWPFSIAMLNYQRVNPIQAPLSQWDLHPRGTAAVVTVIEPSCKHSVDRCFERNRKHESMKIDGGVRGKRTWKTHGTSTGFPWTTLKKPSFPVVRKPSFPVDPWKPTQYKWLLWKGLVPWDLARPIPHFLMARSIYGTFLNL